MDMETRRQDYNQVRGEGKRAIFKAKMMRGRDFARTWRERMRRAICLEWPSNWNLVNRNRDVVRANRVKESYGKIVMEVDRLMEVWGAHYDVLSNAELTWDREGLTDASAVRWPSEKTSTLEVDKAIGKMKQGMSGGPTGVVAEMLKAAGENWYIADD